MSYKKKHEEDIILLKNFLKKILLVDSVTFSYNNPPLQKDSVSCGFRMKSNLLFIVKHIQINNNFPSSNIGSLDLSTFMMIILFLK